MRYTQQERLTALSPPKPRMDGFQFSRRMSKHLLLAVIGTGSSVRGLAWTQDVDHILLHLLEDFLQLGILQHQGPLTRFIVTEQGLVHLTFVAEESNVHTPLVRARFPEPLTNGKMALCYLAVTFAVFQWLRFPSARPKLFSTSIAPRRKRGRRLRSLIPKTSSRENSVYLPSFTQFLILSVDQ